ncbi:biotin--[acetyl-CoA-carboxylase] ligase [Novosphingobium sp.]|uniref:biotin--[acetyl-CoA-carboxylase] ligase n=1 Tax=Novosphingobium sp. TaxID=1874826 RepID=UPI002733ED4A|nr:biotin--[acetyl-CoA-carboxylase] ligase [Novosphingobium sp.]MDP3906044.1 biotin--[acetyl-CoA-carboxylase] ligase [Novosphingobium sp.]
MTRLEVLPETGSTNADLAARIAAGDRVAEGHWLIANRQTAGRGRQGRVWFDGAGNFMGSTVVERRAGDPPPGTLALVAGLAVHEAVGALIPPPHRPELKWPNDVMIGGAKLCGILLEAAGTGVIVGIGVNLAAAPELADRATIALAQFGPAPDRDLFAATLARQFDVEVERWRTFGLEPLVRRWLLAGHPQGTPLLVGEPGEDLLRGTFAGLGTDGALQLRLADGTTRAIHAGEVRLAN